MREPDPTWGDLKTIEIRVRSNPGDNVGVPRKIKANVYGEWAAHPTNRKDMTMISGSWSVTHVPTGLQCPDISPNRGEAMAIAATLGARMPRFATGKEIKQHLREVAKAIRTVLPDAYPPDAYDHIRSL